MGVFSGLPPAPPAPPPDPRIRRTRQRLPAWGWALIVSFGAFVAIMVGYAIVDGSMDHLGILDDPTVRAKAQTACATLSSDVTRYAALPGSPDRYRADAVDLENQAIDAFLADMRSLGDDTLKGDHPAVYWLQDLETVKGLRADGAVDLRTGREPTFVLPRQDDIPISQRMGDLVAECTPAVEILTRSP